jgi:NAD(P)-dependent dehydrogenase (short-subunit alcohol dehydrogenase family)/acyl carrier protein
VVERLLSSGAEVDTVFGGDSFERTGSRAYQVRPGERADYVSLLRALRTEGSLPSRILHLWNTAGGDSTVTVEAFERAQARGFHSVTALAQAFEANHVTNTLQLGMVTTGLQVVLGDETVAPEKAPLLGAIKVAPQELTNLRCRNIDIVLPDTERRNGRTLERIADQLVRELLHEPFEPVVAYRSDRRWVQTFEPLSLEATGGPPPALLKEQGVYLITGGLGSLGLTIAEYLARTVRARLILLGRSRLPGRADWENWVASHAGDETSRRIRSVLALESAGADVLVLSADTSDRTQMRDAISAARKHFGRIDGVIHGAGNTSADGVFPLGQSDPDAARRQFAPKAHGVIVLHELLRDDPPDFLLMLSSLSGVLGGLGLIAYSAANLFLDAYAARQNASGGAPWITVNWDAWQFQTPLTVSASGQTEAILPEAGVTALDRILAHAPRQVVVSVTDLQSRLRKWVYLDTLRDVPTVQKAPSATLHPRPNLSSQYVAPAKEIEKVIAGIWQQVLGVAPIGVHDKFFELGGHSLLAIQLISQLRDAFQVEIAAQRLFEAPTIAQLAETIETSLAAQPPKESEEERLARMLELVEGLSEEEVAELLNDPDALAKISHG